MTRARTSIAASVALVATLFASHRAQAQAPGSADAVFQRARQLVVGGNGSAGRLVIDSVLSATPAESPVHGEAIYWRAALAASAADAEQDYRRVVVEYPLSPHAGDALLQLAQLESARGDRAAATVHLSQFLTDNPKHPDRVRATLLYARLLLEQNDLPRGCAALKQTLKDVPESQVETRNQLEYYLPRCAASDVTPGGAVPVAPAPPTAPAGSSKSDSVPTKAAAESTSNASKTSKTSAKAAQADAKFTLQIAAYRSKAEAEALVRKLKARKIDARVVGLTRLYRVRVGRYATRAAAVSAQKELKAKKIDAFVTDIGSDDK